MKDIADIPFHYIYDSNSQNCKFKHVLTSFFLFVLVIVFYYMLYGNSMIRDYEPNVLKVTFVKA